jgi:PAS domain S-box-containing protein
MGNNSVPGSDGFLAKALKAAFLGSSDYVFIKDTQLVYRAASDSVAELVGLPSADALTGKTDTDIFPEVLAKKYIADDRELLATGVPICGITERLPDVDGAEHWTQTWKRPLYDDSGKIIGLYGTSRDVTSTVRLEEEAKNFRLYERLIKNIPGGVGIMHFQDGVFYLDYANEGCFRAHHFGMEYGRRFFGSRVMEGIYPPDRQLFFDEYERVLGKNDAQGSVTYRVVGEDGGLHWACVRFRPAYQEDGIQYYYASFTDLDEQKQAEASLRDSQDTLKDAINNSKVQYFTYFPDRHRIEIYALNNHYSQLNTVWDNYPDSFLEQARPNKKDESAYRDMVRQIDDGADQASCTVQMLYNGVYLWLKIIMTAVRDETGRTVKAQAYSMDVTAQKNAEERLRRERVRIKTLEGDVFEAYSINVTRNTQIDLQTADTALMVTPVRDEVVRQALAVAPPIGDPDSETRQVMLHVANLIPDEKDRALYLATFCGQGLRSAISSGKYETSIRYRRLINGAVRWVSCSAEVLPDPESGDMIAFFYTRDINDQVIYEKISNQIIGRNYETVSFYDVQTGNFFIKSTKDPLDASFNGIRFETALKAMADQAILPAERDEVLKKFSIPTIKNALAKRESYVVYYTKNEHSETLPGRPFKRMRDDVFYLDENRDVIVFLLTDVTEIFEQERENREKLVRALQTAEKANRAKSEFLSRISHDIRTPMNVINSRTDFAFDDLNDPDKLREDLEDIRASSTFLLSLINDILDISKIDSGTIELHPEPYTLSDYIGTMKGIFQPMCAQKNISLEIIDRGSAGTILVDRVRLNQITLNLLSNAVKYTPAGGAIVCSTGSGRLPGGKIRCTLEIKDNGVGMSKDFQKVMFDPFTREYAAAGPLLTEQGTGLGLAIVKRIVDIMGGSITVKSEAGRGTVITVSFICPEAEPPEAQSGSSPDEAEDDSPLRGTVLVAEDHPMNAEIAQRLLESFGLKVVRAENGAKAAELFSKSAPGEFAAVLMDIQMPVMNGYRASAKIRSLKRPDAKTIPIIAMTADAYSEDVDKCFKAGMDAHVPKPIDAKLLRRTLRRLCS